MRPIKRRKSQKGIALIMVLMATIVVSLGILAAIHGIGNMQRSARLFGTADEAYNAACAGLSVARGYLAGLGTEIDTDNEDATPILPTADAIAPGRVGAGEYTVTLQLNPTPVFQDADWVRLDPEPGQPANVTRYKKDQVYECIITSTGVCGEASRRLSQPFQILFRKIKTVVTREETYIPPPGEPEEVLFKVEDYDILTGGDLTLSGSVNAGSESVLHTNGNFKASGSVTFGTARASGTVTRSGSVRGTTMAGVAPVPLPSLKWEEAKTDPATDLKVGDLKISGSNIYSCPSGKENLYVTGNLNVSGSARITGYKNIFVEGDLSLSGSMQFYGNIFVKGRATISGSTQIYGIVYSEYGLVENDAIKISGSAKVTGGLITRGKIIASGSVFTGNKTYRVFIGSGKLWVPGPPPPPPEPETITVEEITYNVTQTIDESGDLVDVSH